VQTVEPLAVAQRLPIQERDGLMEMDVGAWTGRSLKSLRRTKRWGEIQGSPSTFRFPDGEAFAEALDRIEGAIRSIATRHPRGRVAVATHGDIVRMLVAHFTGAPLDAFQRTVIDTAGVSVVSLYKGSPFVQLVNDTGGLDRFGPAGTPPPWEVFADPNEPPGT
jgi:probable phosphoglycerate mutase